MKPSKQFSANGAAAYEVASRGDSGVYRMRRPTFPALAGNARPGISGSECPSLEISFDAPQGQENKMIACELLKNVEQRKIHFRRAAKLKKAGREPDPIGTVSEQRAATAVCAARLARRASLAKIDLLAAKKPGDYAAIAAARIAFRATPKWHSINLFPKNKKEVAAIAQAYAVDAAKIKGLVNSANGRCTARNLRGGDVWRAIRSGESHIDGGRVTASSYRYSWTTTVATISYDDAQKIKIGVARSSRVTGHSATEKLEWTSKNRIDPSAIGGAYCAVITGANTRACCDSTGKIVTRAWRVGNEKVVKKYGQWEHGATRAIADQETAKKLALIAADEAMIASQRQAQEDRQRAERRAERAARLLAKIGKNTIVDFSMARSAGACEAGIKNWAEKFGVPISSGAALQTIFASEPVWAVRFARKIMGH